MENDLIYCKYCLISKHKNRDDFSPSQLNRKSPMCRECVSIYNKQYCKNNKEKITENKKQYYEENKEEILEQKKQFREENKEKILEYQKQYREGNKVKIAEYKQQYYQDNKVEIDEKTKKYIKNHPEQRKETNKRYSQNHEEEIKQYCEEHKKEIAFYQEQYREKNNEQIKQNRNKENLKKWKKQYKYNKRKTDIIFKLREDISSTINKALKNQGSSKVGQSILNYLSYNIQKLWEHLENQFSFSENFDGNGNIWMTRENHGVYDRKTWSDNDPSTWKWHIDHIIPQSKLPYSSMEDENFKKCWALENLRPLRADLNIKKGNKV